MKEYEELMKAAPLCFSPGTHSDDKLVFSRNARDGYTHGSVTVHKTHSRRGGLGEDYLDAIRMDLRKAFDWEVETFAFEGDGQSG